LLKYKYHIHAIYDPCSYPGIQCKFYFNNESSEQTGIQDVSKVLHAKGKISNKDAKAAKDMSVTTVSFMIFRTGSVLIVGMCEEYVLDVIYDFLTNLLKTEFGKICQSVFDEGHVILKDKKKKIRKKTIVITVEPLPNTQSQVEPKTILVEATTEPHEEEFVILCKPSKKSKKVKVNVKN